MCKFRSSRPEVFCRKGVPRNFAKFTGKHLRQSFYTEFKNYRKNVIVPEACNFIKKATLAQVFPCQFCEISKNTFSYWPPPVAALLNCGYNFSKTFCFIKVFIFSISTLKETKIYWLIYSNRKNVNKNRGHRFLVLSVMIYRIQKLQKKCYCTFFNWVSRHARLNSHCKAWS